MDSYRYCSSCTRRRPIVRTDLGLICCTGCGKILEEDNFSNEPTFVKNAAGQSQMAGNFVRTVEAEESVSRARTLDKAREKIFEMVENMGVGGGDQVIQPAVRFYEIALEKKFVRGRRADMVQGACLYISCRDSNKPFLLIEFSEYLRVNVYVLGAVFLQLCKVLHLQEHPIVQKPVDPSLFIHRFTNGLLGEVNHDVERTALRIMASMKQNWMQTGRKPSGLCGAALYISSLSHGFKFSKAEIVKTVHICEATLTKRLIEFEETESGGLTIEELNEKAEELQKNYNTLKHANFAGSMSREEDLLCEHKGSGRPHFAHGLCETCYQEFINISGGLDGGSEPPAFQRAERARLAMKSANEAADSMLDPAIGKNNCENLNMEKETRVGAGGVDVDQTIVAGVKAQHDDGDGVGMESNKPSHMGIEDDESEIFSDIDDDEVTGYLHNEEEKHYKKIIWEQMNWEYLEEQAAKEAEAAAREAMMANIANGSAEVLDAQKLKDQAAANYAKLKKGRQQKRAAEEKTPQTAAEAAHQMLSKKRTSSRLNHDRLKELFDEPVIPDNTKKSRTETDLENNTLSETNRSEAEGVNHEDEFGMMDEYEELNEYGYYNDDSYYDEEYDDGLF